MFEFPSLVRINTLEPLVALYMGITRTPRRGSDPLKSQKVSAQPVVADAGGSPEGFS